jgi:hypothetical protein
MRGCPHAVQPQVHPRVDGTSLLVSARTDVDTYPALLERVENAEHLDAKRICLQILSAQYPQHMHNSCCKADDTRPQHQPHRYTLLDVAPRHPLLIMTAGFPGLGLLLSRTPSREPGQRWAKTSGIYFCCITADLFHHQQRRVLHSCQAGHATFRCG